MRTNLSLASKENLLNFMLIGQHIILALGQQRPTLSMGDDDVDGDGELSLRRNHFVYTRFSFFFVLCIQLMKTYIPHTYCTCILYVYYIYSTSAALFPMWFAYN